MFEYQMEQWNKKKLTVAGIMVEKKKGKKEKEKGKRRVESIFAL